MAVGDSILLTIARRLARLLKPQDTLARLVGDQFALILLSEKEPARIVAFAETMRRTLRAPIGFNDREIFLTASIVLIGFNVFVSNIVTGLPLTKPCPDFESMTTPCPLTPAISPAGSSVSRL
jgi:predicted signal transduction protein with EAL and GGDEF domain